MQAALKTKILSCHKITDNECQWTGILLKTLKYPVGSNIGSTVIGRKERRQG